MQTPSCKTCGKKKKKKKEEEEEDEEPQKAEGAQEGAGAGADAGAGEGAGAGADAAPTGETASAAPTGETTTTQRFDDGSTLNTVTREDGGTYTYATERTPEITGRDVQRFDDGSTLTTVNQDNGRSFTYATDRPPDYTHTTTQTFDDGSTLSTYHYDDGSTLNGTSQPALEYQTPDTTNTVWDATKLSPSQVNALENRLLDPNLHPDTRIEIEGALRAYETGVDPLQLEGPLEPSAPYPENPGRTEIG